MAANIRCLNPSLGGDGSAFGQLILQCDRDHVQQDVGLGVPAVAQRNESDSCPQGRGFHLAWLRGLRIRHRRGCGVSPAVADVAPSLEASMCCGSGPKQKEKRGGPALLPRGPGGPLQPLHPTGRA